MGLYLRWREEALNALEAKSDAERRKKQFDSLRRALHIRTHELLNITEISNLQDNLELTGFTHDEAFQIILTVIKRG